MNNRKSKFVAATLAVACLAGQTAFAAGKLKVFILAGQSNMQGHANVTTIEYINKDPQTAPMYHEMVAGDGKPKTCDHTWITYVSAGRDGNPTEKNGKLTAGFGATEQKIGPEFSFGIYLEKQIKEPILIIKTAWGGKSLHTDFRPPSAGPYEFNPTQVERFKAQGKDLAAEKAVKAKANGIYYRLMMEHVQKVLADPKKFCPEYDASAGYEIAGFVWFQGWNDMVDSGTYPERDTNPAGYDAYTKALSHFIRDFRSELKVPKLPFVIGVLGVGGPINPNLAGRKAAGRHFRDAMAAPANMPEFKDNVVAVLTEKYWDPIQGAAEEKKAKVKAQMDKMKKDGKKFAKAEQQEAAEKLMAESCTPAELEALKGMSNQGYHYLGSAKILSGIGKGFAEAMLLLQKK